MLDLSALIFLGVLLLHLLLKLEYAVRALELTVQNGHQDKEQIRCGRKSGSQEFIILHNLTVTERGIEEL